MSLFWTTISILAVLLLLLNLAYLAGYPVPDRIIGRISGQTSTQNNPTYKPVSRNPEADPDLDSAVQVSCHKAILCARSVICCVLCTVKKRVIFLNVHENKTMYEYMLWNRSLITDIYMFFKKRFFTCQIRILKILSLPIKVKK